MHSAFDDLERQRSELARRALIMEAMGGNVGNTPQLVDSYNAQASLMDQMNKSRVGQAGLIQANAARDQVSQAARRSSWEMGPESLSRALALQAPDLGVRTKEADARIADAQARNALASGQLANDTKTTAYNTDPERERARLDLEKRKVALAESQNPASSENQRIMFENNPALQAANPLKSHRLGLPVLPEARLGTMGWKPGEDFATVAGQIKAAYPDPAKVDPGVSSAFQSLYAADIAKRRAGQPTGLIDWRSPTTKDEQNQFLSQYLPRDQVPPTSAPAAVGAQVSSERPGVYRNAMPPMAPLSLGVKFNEWKRNRATGKPWHPITDWQQWVKSTDNPYK